MVRDHYQKLGFSLESEAEGTTTWRLDLDAYVAPALEMTVDDMAHKTAAGAEMAHA